MNAVFEPPSWMSDCFSRRLRFEPCVDCELDTEPSQSSSSTTSMGAFIHLRTYRSSYRPLLMTTLIQPRPIAASVPGRSGSQMSASLPRFV